jgi:hypothetical protein
MWPWDLVRRIPTFRDSRLYQDLAAMISRCQQGRALVASLLCLRQGKSTMREIED